MPGVPTGHKGCGGWLTVTGMMMAGLKASVCTQPKTQDSSSEKYGVKEVDGGCERFDSVKDF